MFRSVKAAIGLSVAVVLAGSACSEASRITGPTKAAPAQPSNLLGIDIDIGLGGLVPRLVRPIERTTPLASDVTWSFEAGPAGAVSANSTVGLTIVIPYGALTSNQTITVTALAGAPVAYGFEPHLDFERNVTLRQQLDGTNAGLLEPLLGAHFATDRLELDAQGLLSVTETVPAVTSLLARTTQFRVGHFSGWIVASGRLDSSDESEF
jgi:hypothetical protein